MRPHSSLPRPLPYLLPLALILLPVSDGAAGCLDHRMLGQGVGLAGERLQCDDTLGVSALAWWQGDPLGTNSGLAPIACEASGSECAGGGVPGDGQVTIESDWSNGGMTGCPLFQTETDVGVFVQATDGAGVIALLSSGRLGSGYVLTGAQKYDPATLDPVPLPCGAGSGRPALLSVTPAGGGQIQATVRFPAPVVYSDCEADSVATFYVGPCQNPPALNSTRGQVYVLKGECTSRVDLRRALWTPTGVTPDPAGQASIVAVAPAAGECLFLGGTTRIAGIESGAITGNVAIAGPPCVDADGDGVTGCAGDCDDSDPSRAPNLPEVCDNVDQNCDGRIDEGLDCAGTCATPTKNGADVRITNAPGFSTEPVLAWTGDGFGLAWTDGRDGTYGVYFARLGPSGARLGPERRLSLPGFAASGAALVWDGARFGLAWSDSRNGQPEIYFAVLAPDGSPAAPPARVSTNGAWGGPGLTLAPGGFAIAWSHPYPNGGGTDLFFRRLDSHGGLIGAEQQITSNPQIESIPSIAGSSQGFGVAWSDARLGSSNPEIWFVALDANGARIGPDVQISHGPGTSEGVRLVSAGDGFGALWLDARAGRSQFDTYLARLDAQGHPLTEIPLTPWPSGAGSLAWTGAEFRLQATPPADGSPAGLYTVAADALGVRIGSDFQMVSNPSLTVSAASLAVTNGGFAAAWEDRRTGDSEIFFSLSGCHCVDADGDGWDSCAECDDTRAAVNPAVVDQCNGLDENCTGYADDDAAGSDSDLDQVANACDDCRFVANPEQADVNFDGVGDLCDLSDGLIMVMMRDAATVEWQMETGTTSFNVYRAGMPGLVDPDHDGAASSYGMCLASTLAAPALADAASPAPGAAFLYHVTSRGPGGESGLGNASSGAPRPNTSPCP